MSFLGRLFGGGTSAPPATSVVIDADLAARLTADGTVLTTAVDSALRQHLSEQDRAADHAEDERMPFWLARDAEAPELEEQLRDRVIQRHESEDGSKD